MPDTSRRFRWISGREVALTLHQIEECRRVYDALKEDLDYITDKIGSEVLQVEIVLGRASPLRAQLQGKHLTLQAERRQIAVQREREVRELTSKLLELLNKYSYLVDEPD